MSDLALLNEIIDRLDRIESKLQDRSNVTDLWLDKRRLAAELGMSVRWVEDRMPEGMPHRYVGKRPQFALRDVEAWLTKRGLLRRAS